MPCRLPLLLFLLLHSIRAERLQDTQSDLDMCSANKLCIISTQECLMISRLCVPIYLEGRRGV